MLRCGNPRSTEGVAAPAARPDDLLEHVEPAAAMRRLSGGTGRLAAALATGLSLYALYWVVGIVQPQVYRVSFLLVALVLTFLLYAGGSVRGRAVSPIDWVLVGLAVVALVWPLADFDRFVYRAATPGVADLACGVVTILLVLEATRRTVGWILPATALGFLAYAYLGPLLDLVGLRLIGHRGYGLDRLVGTLFMTLEGIFGVPLDVAATYIVLFTIYGAILHHSGAGKFFLDWSMALMGRSAGRSAPGRTVAMAGLLLGAVSGSGVANTVTLGVVGWPLLRRAGFEPERGGAILAASGIGAMLAPPMLGAAAFLIAEFLKIPYLNVIVMAVVPALLYYVSIALMIEADSRRLATVGVDADVASLWQVTRQGGYHFASLAAIVMLMVAGVTVFRAVLWASVMAFGLSFVRAETALTLPRLLAALEAAGRGVLSIASTTATAGIIVGVVALTGLGLRVAGIIVTLAGGSLVLTVVYAAVAVWTLGLAVPVTASYIIAAVMVAPAMIQVGVPDLAAHMFIFYYAVLSEVSPPTALSPFAAAALTGGNPFKTMMLTWKYTLPAFLVPFVFTLSREGMGLLLVGPVWGIILVSLTAAVGVAALAVGLSGWLRRRASPLERAAATAAGLLLVYADVTGDLIGLALFGLTIASHWRRVGRLSPAF